MGAILRPLVADASIERFRQVVSVAYAHLEERREEINDLNVFPVADGDTGDNMALTLRHVLEELDRLQQESDGDPKRPEIVRAVARAALMGARGNSGVILSQIVRGAAERLATPPGRLIDPELVEAALENASDAAWASVRDPADGTMLTVARAMADAVRERRAHWDSHRLDADATDSEQNALLAEMLAAALFAGEEAVRHTPEQLDVLAKAGVVDAGALGLVVIVRGALAALAGETVTLPEIPRYEPAHSLDVHHTESRFRFCTNFIVTGEGLDGDRWVAPLEELGDSVLVVGDEATLKVHVHTDDPRAAKALFDGVGTVQREDIADMRDQIAERDARLAQTRTSAPVAVASGAGIRALYEGLGAQVVDGGPTMNPSTNDLLTGADAAPGSEVVLFPNSKNVLMAAEEAARLCDKPVEVVASDSQQGALAALIEFDADGSAALNAGRMRALLEEIRVGGVAPAAKDDLHGRFARGDCVGFEGEDAIAWGGTGTTLAATVARLAEGAEILTILAGAEAPIPLGELDLELPGTLEVELHEGGQPAWWWLIAAQ